MSQSDSGNLLEQMKQIETLLQQAESIADPAAREITHNTIRALMDLHGDGLSRIVDQVSELGPAGQSAMEAMAQDDVVSSLLLVYNLHPHDLPTRVRTAIAKLPSHGKDVELLDIPPEGSIRLALHGHHCSSSIGTLKTTIEQSILAAAPDAAGIQIETDPAGGAAGFVSPERVVASAVRLTEGANV